MEVRNVARNGRELLRPAQFQRGIAFEQGPRVGVPRVVEDVVDVGVLDDFARVHDRDLVAQLGDQAQIVRNQHDGRAELRPGLPDQVDDLRLDGDVEGGGRLVRDQEGGIHQQRHGDAGPLAHAPAELVRIIVDPGLRVRNSDPPHHLAGFPRLRLASQLLAAVEDVRHLRLVVVHRDLRRHGILEDHRDFLAAEPAQPPAAEPEYVGPLIERFAGNDGSVAGKQAHDRPDQGALAGSAFADHAENSALRDRDADVPERMDQAARRSEIDVQPLDFEQRLQNQRIPRSFGSITSLSASPRSVNPSVVNTSGIPPAITGQGDERITR